MSLSVTYYSYLPMYFNKFIDWAYIFYYMKLLVVKQPTRPVFVKNAIHSKNLEHCGT